MSPISSTLDWIIACERHGLLTSADVRRFRQLAEITGEDFSPRVVLKWLTTRDRMTAEQADRILSGPPNLGPVDAIIRVLGDFTDQSATLELDSPERDPDDLEEDTKDLTPLDREEVRDLVLPPRGSPAFAGTVAAPTHAAVPNSDSTATAAEPSDTYSLQPDTDYARRLDELLADATEKSEPLPSLRSQPIEQSPQPAMMSTGILAAAAAAFFVVVAAVYALWRASR